MASHVYRPPMSSDSEDDFDGFSFGDEFDESRKIIKSQNCLSELNARQQQRERYDNLIKIIREGDIKQLQEKIPKKSYNEYLEDGWTILLHACNNMQFDMIKYLIDNDADVNVRGRDSLTPLMVVCKINSQSKDSVKMLEIAKFLLENSAVVNVRDEIGCTPLMFACGNNNKKIVELLLPVAAVNAWDNTEKTALYYAIESKNIDIVKLLIENDADINYSNRSGMKPREFAAINGFTNEEIDELFGVINVETMPLNVASYETYHDLAPTCFPERKRPPYAQEVFSILNGMRVSECRKQFYDAEISLPQLLLMDEQRLKDIGVEFDYQRKRVLFGLLKFHEYPWSPKSISIVDKSRPFTMYQYYIMYSNYLKHLIIMKTTITYLQRQRALCEYVKVDDELANDILLSLDKIQTTTKLLQYHVRQISKLTPPNPLLVDSKQNRKYKQIIPPFVKYTLILGIGLLVANKLKDLIH